MCRSPTRVTRKNKNQMRKRINISYATLTLLLTAALMLAACSSDSTDDAPDQLQHDEIRLKADAWQFMAGTRATTYNSTNLQSEAFTCYAYQAGTTTKYIDGAPVSYTDGNWSFTDGKKYWPATGSLDFFAYMPATPPSYITSGPTYTEDHNVTFTCTNLDMVNATEFVYDLVTGKNKDNASEGVSLTFKHPFARINLRWANYDHSDITSVTVKFKGVKNNGSYNKSATPQWTTSDDDIEFTVTELNEYNAASPTYYLAIPQNWTGAIEVNASWNDWGDTPVPHTVTATIPTTWESGYSYTYTFNITPEDLTVNTSNFTEQW